MDKRSKVVVFVSDLFTRMSVEGPIEKLGYDVIWWNEIEGFSEIAQEKLPDKRGEHLSGPGYQLADALTKLQPAALIFDLSEDEIPWETWIHLLKSASATRRIPIISFGPHVETETLEKARKAGSDLVVPRSALTRRLPQFFNELQRISPIDETDSICQRAIHPDAQRGIEAFNNGDYFDAHEHFEAAWMSLDPREGVLYRALLQVAVIYYHIQSGNYAGAVKVYLRVRQWLSRLPDRCQGICVSGVKANLEKNIDLLKQLGEENISEFDMENVEKIIVTEIDEADLL